MGLGGVYEWDCKRSRSRRSREQGSFYSMVVCVAMMDKSPDNPDGDEQKHKVKRLRRGVQR